MAETTVATNVHQTLDVHGCFTTEVTFDRHGVDEVTNFFKFSVRQLFDFLGILNAALLANLTSTSATNTENGSQANFSMFVRRNVDTCNTSHDGPL